MSQKNENQKVRVQGVGKLSEVSERSRWTGPPHLHCIERPDGQGSCTGECGDSIEIMLRVRDNVITEATFSINGCGATYAAATTIARLAVGRRPNEAFKLTAIDVMDSCDDLPENHEHCAIIAVNALHTAIADAIRCSNEPWRSMYR